MTSLQFVQHQQRLAAQREPAQPPELAGVSVAAGSSYDNQRDRYPLPRRRPTIACSRRPDLVVAGQARAASTIRRVLPAPPVP